LHIFALSSGDIFVVLSESAARDFGNGDCCCAYTWILLQIAKSNKPEIRTENTAKIERFLLILKSRDAILLLM
jgi:hypothetical protein